MYLLKKIDLKKLSTIDLKKIEFRFNPKNKHKYIALFYAGVIAFAFIISATKNTPVVASVSRPNIQELSRVSDNHEAIANAELEDAYAYAEEFYDDSMDISLLESGDDSGAKISIFDSIRNMLSSSHIADSPVVEELPTRMVSKEILVKTGDNFIGILTNQIGMEYSDAFSASSAFSKVFKPTSLKVGQKIKFEVFENVEESKFISLEKITIPNGAAKRFVLARNLEDDYVASVEEDALSLEKTNATGVVEGNLSVAMSKAGVPASISSDFINIFSFSVDFRRDLREGDSFEVIYESKINPKGDVVGSGEILYAGLNLRNDKLALYRFEDTKGKVDYYSESGVALKKTLDRKPIAHKNARISSSFGKRRHPILKTVKVHWGVDYAAPRGTAIYAAGDGVVQMAKYNGGYGNYVRIRHNSEYTTAYGHMHNIAKGIRSGVRVKQGQVIGYVGSTGRSTGPHLHYEVVKNGKRVNPVTIKAATGENLKGKDLTKFKTDVASIVAEKQNLFASADKDKSLAEVTTSEVVVEGKI